MGPVRPSSAGQTDRNESRGFGCASRRRVFVTGSVAVAEERRSVRALSVAVRAYAQTGTAMGGSGRDEMVAVGNRDGLQTRMDAERSQHRPDVIADGLDAEV